MDPKKFGEVILFLGDSRLLKQALNKESWVHSIYAFHEARYYQCGVCLCLLVSKAG